MQATAFTTAPANTALIASDNVATFFNAAPQAADSPARKVSLFRNGANQAVRIPKEFELPGKEATMRREGNRLIIEAVQPKFAKGTAGALLAALEEIRKLGPCNDEFPDVDEGLLPLDDINL